jgi:adenine nucleotide transporter 17
VQEKKLHLVPTEHPVAGRDPVMYDGSLDCALKVAQHEGWPALYRGLTSALFGMGLSSAVYFYWYQFFKAQLLRRTQRKSMTPAANTAVACLAGVVNVFLTTPIWVVNTRMTLQRPQPLPNATTATTTSTTTNTSVSASSTSVTNGINNAGASATTASSAASSAAANAHFNGVFDALAKIYAAEGIHGLYKGVTASLILVTNPVIQFVTYEQMVKFLVVHRIRNGQDKTLSSFEYFVFGAIAKALATVVTYPYQVVKSRLQAQGLSTKYHGTWHVCQRIWSDEGMLAFYQGMGAKLSQTVGTSAFMFMTYEKLYRLVRLLVRLVERRNPSTS